MCEVVASRVSGGYRVFSLRDEQGGEPEPGQFYMLAAERGWGEGGARPYLPRALSVADAVREGGAVRLDFLVEGVGPGTERLCALAPGERVWVNGPLGNGFSMPRELNPDAPGAILIGGGIGIAPLALLRRRLAARGVPAQILLGFRDAAHSGGLDDLFSNCQIGLASEDGHVGERGYVTELLAAMLIGDDAASAAVYACGPPPMLDAVAALCAERGAACELAHEAPMACGFGACFGCAVPDPSGDGYLRLCVDGPVLRLSPSGETDARRPAGPVAAMDTPCLTRQGESISMPPAGEAETADASPGAVVAAASAESASAAGGVDIGVPSRVSEGAPVAATGPAARSPLEFCGIELEHPVINASGTFDAIAARRVYGEKLWDEFPFSAFVSKTITLEGRKGNPPQRIWETAAGMINSIGLPNKGLEGFLERDLPQLGELPAPLIVSIMASAREDFARMVTALDDRDEVAAIELNVSCPNVHSGLIVGERPEETLALLGALRPLTAKPLIVKLTPNVADPAAVALGAEEGGADAVSLINTIKASAIDPATGEPGIGVGRGGLSGAAVLPIAVAQVRAVRAAVGLPIVGMGGVASGADAAALLAAGAALVAVGTESFRDPLAGRRIARELIEQKTFSSLPSTSS